MLCCSLASESALAALDLFGGVSGIYQQADDAQVDAEASGSADLFLTWTSATGEWLVYVQAGTAPLENGVASWYPSANADAGAVLDGDGGAAVRVSELNYSFRFPEGHMLMIGLIDPSAWLDRSRLANDENQHFLNTSFVNNATIAFPDFTFGTVIRLKGVGSRPELSFVVSASDGLADLPGRSYGELFNITDDGRGAFVGAGASWAGRHLAGFAALAFERQFQSGLFGIGVAETYLSSTFDGAERGDSLDAEIYFRISFAGGATHITPSLQYIRNPAFGSSGRLAVGDGIVGGVRLRVKF